MNVFPTFTAWYHSSGNSASDTSLLPRERWFCHCHQVQFPGNVLVLAPENSPAAPPPSVLIPNSLPPFPMLFTK